MRRSFGARISLLYATVATAPPRTQTDAVRLLHSTFHGYVSLEKTGGFDHNARSANTSWVKTLDALHSLLTSWPAE